MIVTVDRAVSGTGTGQSDIAPIGISIVEIKNEFDLNVFVGIEALLSGELGAYSCTMELSVTPGFFYIGDREFYLFNDKLSQVSRAIASGEYWVIPLGEFPDGVGNRRYLDYARDQQRIIERMPSAMFLSQFSSGELTGLSIPVDVIFSSRTGYLDVAGYTLGSGEVVEGEVAFPGWFSPLSRFGRGFEYWNSGELVVPPDAWYYDLPTNAIVIPTGELDVASGDEFYIEFEGRNEPLYLNYDLSPDRVMPDDYILTISPSGEVGAVPETVTIHLADRWIGEETIGAAIEVRNADGNLIDAIVTVDLAMSLEGSDGGTFSDRYPLETSFVSLVSGEQGVFDLVSVTVPSGLDELLAVAGLDDCYLLHDDVVLATPHRIGGAGGYACIPSVGYLRIGEVPVRETTLSVAGESLIVIDSPPAVGPHRTVTLSATAGDVGTSGELVLFGSGEDTYYADDPALHLFYGRPDHVYYASQTGELIDGPLGSVSGEEYAFPAGTVVDDLYTYIRMPDDCLSPSSLALVTLGELANAHRNAAEYGYGLDRAMGLSPDHLRVISGSIYTAYDYVMTGEMVTIRYPRAVRTTVLDGRDRYGIPAV